MFGDSPVQDQWFREQKELPVNFLEFKAVLLTLLYFSPQIYGHHTLIRMDNMSAKVYLNNPEGIFYPPQGNNCDPSVGRKEHHTPQSRALKRLLEYTSRLVQSTVYSYSRKDLFQLIMSPVDLFMFLSNHMMR